MARNRPRGYIPGSMSAKRRMGCVVAWALSAALLGGCPDARDQGPTAACSKAYDKCVLSTGVLGVCNIVDCPQDQAAPCFVCRSQH